MRKQPDPSPADRASVLRQAVSEAAKRLQIGPTDLGQIIGVSQPTASRLLKGEYDLRASTKEWELSAFVVRLYRSLFSLVGGDDSLARGWLHAPNRAFPGQRPIDLIKRVDGLIHVCEYLDAYRARV
ncbi:MAG TPA: antitoxin Xre/MbcA/ParS toxin-binding domain-containing protein [Aromatoleum sp.]|uniref:antitoxin Xre/MbcA/ParS toxin-binding domain-containing protein n=1 Tax=Aromatoleum sp. TaxID=2307007 RepID=UPI002B47C712|nr:antitoxin Xre/MbcA/ParS toxin-binding domain-containing protein [Aromatoleum sp.]HJV24706.1 antitoxin Xre/MbcA/ParS toxin-binding domain-containing protein [Aromatoleum sp.]